MEINIFQIYNGMKLTTIYEHIYYCRLYMGNYTEAEAEKLFKKYVIAEDAKIFVNQPIKKIQSCICLTSGIRNDHSHPDGLCQNGHDDWLEYRDVFLLKGADAKPRNRAKKVFNVTLKELQQLFCDTSITQISLAETKSMARKIEKAFSPDISISWNPMARMFRIVPVSEAGKELLKRTWQGIQYKNGRMAVRDQVVDIVTFSTKFSLCIEYDLDYEKYPDIPSLS